LSNLHQGDSRNISLHSREPNDHRLAGKIRKKY
jgi:hypothetical protein